MANEQLPDLVVGRGIIIDDAHNILLLQRAACCRNGGQWECPGGKLETHELHEQLAGTQREIHEEAGVRVEFLDPQPIYTDETIFPDNGRRRTTLFFLARSALERVQLSLQLSEVKRAAIIPLHEALSFNLADASRGALEVLGDTVLHQASSSLGWSR